MASYICLIERIGDEVRLSVPDLGIAIVSANREEGTLRIGDAVKRAYADRMRRGKRLPKRRHEVAEIRIDVGTEAA